MMKAGTVIVPAFLSTESCDGKELILLSWWDMLN